MPNDKTEVVKFQLPDGSIQPFEIPAGLNDDQARTFVLSKRPDLFSNQQQAETGYLSGLKSSIPDRSSLMQSTLRRLAFGGIDPIGDLQTLKSIPGAIKAGAASASEVSPSNFISQIIAKGIGGTTGALAPAVGVNPESMRQRALAGDTSGILGEATIPTATALLTAGGKFAAEKLAANSPSALRAQAGKTLGNIKQSAGGVPVDTSQFGGTALELWTQADRGAGLPLPIRKLVNRLVAPGSSPLTYEEAKDFQSNISNLLANPVGEEGARIKNANVYRLATQLNSQMKSSLEQASQKSGMQPGTFSGAMKQYAQASSRQDMIDTLKDLALKEAGKGAVKGAGIAVGTVGAGGVAYRLLKELGVIP